MYFVYIVQCSDGTYYTGSTDNLEKRMHAHNHLKSGAHYTKIRRPVTCVYSKECASYSEARSEEAAIKRMSRTEKRQLIQNKRLSQ